jgi:hypothetical protein
MKISVQLDIEILGGRVGTATVVERVNVMLARRLESYIPADPVAALDSDGPTIHIKSWNVTPAKEER